MRDSHSFSCPAVPSVVRGSSLVKFFLLRCRVKPIQAETAFQSTSHGTPTRRGSPVFPCLACLASPPMREPQPRTPPQLLLPFPSCYIRITGQCRKFPSMAHRDWFDDLGFGGPNCSVLSPQRAALRCKQRATSWRIDCDRGSTGVNTDVDWFFGPRALLPELEGNLTRWCVLLLGVHTLAHTTQTARSPQRCEVTLATLSAGCDRSCRSAPV